MPRTSFHHTIEPDGLRLALVQRRFPRRDTMLPPTAWDVELTDEAFSGTARVLEMLDADDGRARPDGDCVWISHAAVADLDEIQSLGLGLPPVVPFVLEIDKDGLVSESAFALKVRWTAEGGRSVNIRRTGAFLETFGGKYRIPNPLFSIVEAIDSFAHSDTSDEGARFSSLARLQEILPTDGSKPIRLDGYLRTIRILHATAFSLRLRTDETGFRFDPVLFGRRVAETSADGSVVSEGQSLLTERQTDIFVGERFQGHSSARDRYVIDRGTYVYVDPPLKRALDVVRRLQGADEVSRRDFARRPQVYLKEELSSAWNEDDIEYLFIETEQYSARVVDIGIWQPPVLPWLKQQPNDWLPEKFGVKIGEKYVQLAPEELPPLREAVERAISEGRPTVSFKGEQIPANQGTCDALNSLIGVVKPKPSGDEEDATKTEHICHVLIVSDNFEQIDFTRNFRPRGKFNGLQIPGILATTLKPHQESGLEWLQKTWHTGLPGVLLADDMGLGKTLQALAFLAWLRNMDPRQTANPALVVAPTGLLKNWEAEQDKHLSGFGLGEICRAYGSALSIIRLKPGRDLEGDGSPRLDIDPMRRADWVLTTYETLRDYHLSFARIPFRCVVFDEIQKVKSPGALVTRGAKIVNADFALGMTGTPIENRLEDLWSIMDILSPGRFGDLKSFSGTYRSEDMESLDRLRKSLLEPSDEFPAPVLRRMKADHLEGLPKKVIHVRPRIMPATQAQAYADTVARAKGADPCPILETLHRMRGISLHPVWPPAGSITDPSGYIGASARVSETIAILDEIEKAGEKSLLFIESLDVQRHMAMLIKQRYRLDHLPMIINGAVAGEKRQKSVDAFQARSHGFDVMILSPKAGGVGLTLTAANHVIHLSRWWNPAVEDQCTDRTYRIGQQKIVNVYYPMAVHPEYGEQSFDHLLHRLLERKRELGRRMLVPPVNLQEDQAYFAKHFAAERKVDSTISIDEIDVMAPLEFEHWIASRMADAGYVADLTPATHDFGADGIFRHVATGACLIVQCKHRQDPEKPCDDSPVDDLLRAREAYPVGAELILAAITNAKAYSPQARNRARLYDVTLVDRTRLAQWPQGVL